MFTARMPRPPGVANCMPASDTSHYTPGLVENQFVKVVFVFNQVSSSQ